MSLKETFFEVMADLSNAWYEKGFPAHTAITHIMYTKETENYVRKNSDQNREGWKEDPSG